MQSFLGCRDEKFSATVYRKPFAVTLPPHKFPFHPPCQSIPFKITFVYRLLTSVHPPNFLTLNWFIFTLLLIIEVILQNYWFFLPQVLDLDFREAYHIVVNFDSVTPLIFLIFLSFGNFLSNFILFFISFVFLIFSASWLFFYHLFLYSCSRWKCRLL